MSETNLSVGDIVKLKSGGPIMTVVEVPIGEPERIACTWFEKGTKKHSGYFPPKALTRVDSEDTVPRQV